MGFEIPVLPTPPTDNYHKFKAIAGLWMVVGSFVLCCVVFFYIDRERYNVEMRMATLVVDAHVLGEDAHALNQDDPANPHEPSREGRIARSQALEKNLAQTKVSLERAQTLSSALPLVLFLGSILAFFGLIITRQGFRGWRKLQMLEEGKTYGHRNALRVGLVRKIPRWRRRRELSSGRVSASLTSANSPSKTDENSDG